MSITAFLAEFSIPEILQFIEKGHKTGLLTIHIKSASPASKSSVHYIWVNQGCLVAAAMQLNQQGLVKLIEEQQWVSDRVFDKLIHWCCPISEPMGTYLKSQGVLHIEQLKELFYLQVLQPVSTLFQLKDGILKFDQNVSIPTREMTGLSISAGVLQHCLLRGGNPASLALGSVGVLGLSGFPLELLVNHISLPKAVGQKTALFA
ncbi:DUF4388 domain-containing protein [Allocoleopsis sp.]|uniref:DUF4388 domain-containing protein n=1 Tax=Allocoleopsis sp. TaxID=3088169 RepID=UPI002FD3AB0B